MWPKFTSMQPFDAFMTKKESWIWHALRHGLNKSFTRRDVGSWHYDVSSPYEHNFLTKVFENEIGHVKGTITLYSQHIMTIPSKASSVYEWFLYDEMYTRTCRSSW